MLELAEYDYQKAIELDSHNRDYLLNHVDILITLGRKTDALADLETLSGLGMALGELKDFYDRLRKRK